MDPNDQAPPQPPASPPPKPPPAQDETYLASLRNEAALRRQQYQEQKAIAESLQARLDSMADYDALKTSATALEQQLRNDRLTAKLAAELGALGITDPAKQALVVKATDLTVTWDDTHQPQGDFSALKKTVDTLGLAPASPPADSGSDSPGEGGTQAPGNGSQQTPPPPPKVSGATHKAPGSGDRPVTYEEVVAAGHEILDRVRSEGA
jgi:hypothetical protein